MISAASRSTSPSSRSNYGANYQSAYRQTGTIPKKTPNNPRSLANSRETSPTRSATVRRLGYMPTQTLRRPDRPPINPSRPVLAQKILQASREAENALADALVRIPMMLHLLYACQTIELSNVCFCSQSPDDSELAHDISRLHLRKISRDESDESEASSVCSERSFDSFRRNDVSK